MLSLGISTDLFGRVVGDEIVLTKLSSGAFNATNIECAMRSIGVDRLVICGVYIIQGVESAVRDAADRGFLVTLVNDACGGRPKFDWGGALGRPRP